MANQRWNERGREDDRARGRRDDDRDRGRGDRRDDSEAGGTYGRRQFSDDANQGGYAQGQYAREQGRHEQSGYGHGGRDGQGGAGQNVPRRHWMASDDDRNRPEWEASRYGGSGSWARSDEGGGSGGGQREGGWGREGGGRGGGFERGGYAQHAYEDRGRWSGRDDEHRGNFGRGFDARGRDVVGREGPGERGMSWAGGPVDDWGRRNDGPWRQERGGMRDHDEPGDRGFGTRGFRGDEEPRYRPDTGGRPGGSPWHLDDDRSPSGGVGRHGRSGLDYGRFDNDDQDIRVHGGKLRSRDDDDHRYGMGLQGGAGRGRWVQDPRYDDERYEARERGSWGRQVWAEDERYGTRGGDEHRRPDDRGRPEPGRWVQDRGQERWEGREGQWEKDVWQQDRSARGRDEGRGREQEPWRGHGRSDRDRDDDRGSPVTWRGGNFGGRGWEDRGRDPRHQDAWHGRDRDDGPKRGEAPMRERVPARSADRARDDGREGDERREGGGGSREVGGRGPSARQEGRRVDRDWN